VHGTSSKEETTKQRLLREAATLLGQEELATRLKVSESLIGAWVTGEATMPDGKLLMLAEVLDSWAHRPKAK
jgi:transcriptional regulator with XRE-family HTH domain